MGEIFQCLVLDKEIQRIQCYVGGQLKIFGITFMMRKVSLPLYHFDVLH
jgi:hypothetical protein